MAPSGLPRRWNPRRGGAVASGFQPDTLTPRTAHERMSSTAVPPPPAAPPGAPRSRALRMLDAVERAGNLLPHPATLFLVLSLLVVVLSAMASAAGLQVTHPGTGEPVRAVNLLSVDGLHRILTGMITNFTGFAPLGTVLVALLGISVAETSGLINAALRSVVLAAPRRLLTLVVVASGVLSHLASDVGYVLLIPLSATIFLAAGRHPLAGLAAAFAGVSGGFSANFLIGPTDALLAGITQEAARIVNAEYVVTPAANWYFMAASAVAITAVGTWITERLVEPRLGPYTGPVESAGVEPLSPAERRGLRFAGVALLAFVAFLLAGTIPADGYLRNPETGDLLRSPLLSGVVALIFFAGVLLGCAYGIGARTLKGDEQVIAGMTKAMETMGMYLVLVFFAAQFIALFNWTNLGVISAVHGAEMLKSSGLSGVALIILFVLVAMFVDLVIGSASAKWALMAPIFVPMFMLLGLSPELTQAAYRIGDSVANIVTPMMSYFPLVVTFAQRYDRTAGIGTIVATMLPYSVAFLVVWTGLLVAWYLGGLPLGPGAGLFYTP